MTHDHVSSAKKGLTHHVTQSMFDSPESHEQLFQCQHHGVEREAGEQRVFHRQSGNHREDWTNLVHLLVLISDLLVGRKETANL